MQIIERSSFGLRAATWEFRHPDHELRFRVFPMIHLGQPSFYRDVSDRIKGCDLLLWEGVPSRKVGILTQSYRLIARRKRLELVTQSEGMRISELGVPLVHADLSEAEFEAEWEAVPLWLRAALLAGAPLFGAYQYCVASRSSIAKHLQITDLPSREDVIMEDSKSFQKVEDLILDKRDSHLLSTVDRIFKENSDETMTAGLLYGAGHMRVVIRFLQGGLGYSVAEADWMTVFES